MKAEKQYFIDNSDGTLMYSTNYIQEVNLKIISSGFYNYEKWSVLLSDNRTLLTDKLGKQDFCTSDSSGRRLHIWKRNLPSGDYWIITGGNGRGTSYEIDDTVDPNMVMMDIVNIFDLNPLLSVIQPFNLHRLD